MSISKTKDAPSICVWSLALKSWKTDHLFPVDTETDPMFSAFLRAPMPPQMFRYLRRWLGDNWEGASLATVREIRASLEDGPVHKSLRGLPIKEIAEIANRVEQARRDLEKAALAYVEFLGEVDAAPTKKKKPLPPSASKEAAVEA